MNGYHLTCLFHSSWTMPIAYMHASTRNDACNLHRTVGGWQADGSQAVSGSLVFKFDSSYLQSPTQTKCVCVKI